MLANDNLAHRYCRYIKAFSIIYLALFAICTQLSAQKTVELAVYIDPLNHSYYYYSYNYLRKALHLEEFRTKVHSLNELRFKLDKDHVMDNSLKRKKNEIYLVVVSQNHLESYQQVLEFIDRQYHLVLWILTSRDFTPLGFDAMTSASTKDEFLQVFRAKVLPKIMSLYTGQ